MTYKFKMIFSCRIFCIVLLNLNLFSEIHGLIKIHSAKSEYKFYVPYVRIKRQEGYVYDKPNVTFNLPIPTTNASPVAPMSQPLSQQMYYAYPAPSSGTVNIGYSTTDSSANTENRSATGYSYSSQQNVVTDGTNNIVEDGRIGTQNTEAIGTQNSLVQQTKATSDTLGLVSNSPGYNYKAPTQSTITSAQTFATVSTNAPKYLPPTGNSRIENNVTPSVSIEPMAIQEIAMQSGVATFVPALNTGYLPPNVTPSFSSTTSISPSMSKYLPPAPTAGSVSNPPTPAPTYLPPVF